MVAVQCSARNGKNVFPVEYQYFNYATFYRGLRAFVSLDWLKEFRKVASKLTKPLLDPCFGRSNEEIRFERISPEETNLPQHRDVPFVEQEDGSIILKTACPNRKRQ